MHYILKIRIFLNSRFNSIENVESKEKKFSLFKMATLYSHFKIIFNLNTVFIALFLYPGKYWDSFFEKPFMKNKFSGAFARNMYWNNRFDEDYDRVDDLDGINYYKARALYRFKYLNEFFLHKEPSDVDFKKLYFYSLPHS